MKILVTLLSFLLLSCASIGTDLVPKDELSDMRLSVVRLVNYDEQGHGTGFAVKVDGKTRVITNSHVCDLGAAQGALYADSIGPRIELKILKVGYSTDLCMLEGFQAAKPLKISKQGLEEDHEVVQSFGFPALPFMTHTVGRFLGFITAEAIPTPWVPKEECTMPGAKWVVFFMQDFCVQPQTFWISDLKIDGGASGSPLLNADKEIVGVLSIGIGRNGFAGGVPLEKLKEFLGVKQSKPVSGAPDSRKTGEHKRIDGKARPNKK